jgi:Spy/CpxP family protein refolding chaperone
MRCKPLFGQTGDSWRLFSHTVGLSLKLGVLLCLFISLFAVSPSGAQVRAPGQRHDFQNKLNLTPDQQDKMRAHLHETMGKITSARQDLQSANLDLFNLLGNYNVDHQKLQGNLRRINSCQKRLLNIHLDSQIKLRSILTQDQFQTLREQIGDRGTRSGDDFMDGMPRGDVKSLGLSADQQDRIRKLFTQARENMMNLRHKFHTDSESLESLYLDYNLDVKLARQKIDLLSSTDMALLKATTSRQVELRSILTADQFQTLSKSIRPPTEVPPPFGEHRWHNAPKQ